MISFVCLLLGQNLITKKSKKIELWLQKRFLEVILYIYSDILDTNDVYLRKYNAIVVENFAGRVTLSLGVILVAALRYIYL